MIINHPFPHVIVIMIEQIETFLYIAIMVNLICYIILKLTYFVFFAKMNSLLDENILLLMKTVSLGLAGFSILAQIVWKVWDWVTYILLKTFHSWRFTKNNISWVWSQPMFSLVGPKLPINGTEASLEGIVDNQFYHLSFKFLSYLFKGLSWIYCSRRSLLLPPTFSLSFSWRSLWEMIRLDRIKTGPPG